MVVQVLRQELFERLADIRGRMEASLIGLNVSVRRNNSLPNAYRFMIGDNSEIEIL